MMLAPVTNQTPPLLDPASALTRATRTRAVVIPAETPRERYARLRQAARDAVLAGRLHAALGHLEQCLDIARDIGDPGLEALAICNRAAVAVTTGEIHRHVPDLRAILMRNYAADTSFAAAYNLAQAYESQKQYKKSLFYARIARDRAEAADDQEFLAKSHSQLGLSLLGESYFEDASDHFEKSLDLMPQKLSSISVSPHLSLAYCMIVLGRAKDGMSVLYRCLRWLRRRREPLFQTWAHLFLGCGYLQLRGDHHRWLQRAWLHVRRANELAEQVGDAEAVKASLFMLGEVERTAGDTAAAYECFREVQERFYPSDDDLAALLSRFGTGNLVNLRA